MKITVKCDKCNNEIVIDGNYNTFEGIILYAQSCSRCLELARIQTEDDILSDKPNGEKNDNT